MKELGIVRPIDSVGRIVLPIEMRKELGICEDGSKIEITSHNNQIILKKVQENCIFCDNENDLIEFNGYKLCKECAESISKLK